MSTKAATAEFLKLQNLISEKEAVLLNRITEEIASAKSMRATTNDLGMTTLSTAKTITDPNACALSATENNSTIAGTLAHRVGILELLKEDITPMDHYNSLSEFPDNGTPRIMVNGVFTKEIDKAVYGESGQYFNIIYIISDWRPYARELQLAVPAFWVDPCIYIRRRHDDEWSKWVKISGVTID